MADVFDYLKWRGDLPFEAVPPNAGDRLILSLLSFADFDGIVSKKIGKDEIPLHIAAARYLTANTTANNNMSRLLEALAQSRRFGQLLLSGYITKLERRESLREQTQFGALSVRTDGHLSVIYRGTDDTLVGWKENFNSLLLSPIPAQAQAADYLSQAAQTNWPLAVQGHSKGGNLAVYAAAASKVPAV